MIKPSHGAARRGFIARCPARAVLLGTGTIVALIVFPWLTTPVVAQEESSAEIAAEPMELDQDEVVDTGDDPLPTGNDDVTETAPIAPAEEPADDTTPPVANPPDALDEPEETLLPAAEPPETSDSVTVAVESCLLEENVCASDDSQEPDAMSLGETRTAEVAPSAEDVLLACDQEEIVRPYGDPAVVTCTFTALATMPAPVTLTHVVVPLPAGWEASAENSMMTGQSLVIFQDVTLAPGVAHEVAFSLWPTCVASDVPAQVSFLSAFSYADEGIGGPSTAFTAALAPGTSVAVSITGVAHGVSVPQSTTPQLAQHSLTYDVIASGCDGWSVHVEATDFVYSGQYGGRDIPVTNLIVRSAGIAVLDGTSSGVFVLPLGSLQSPLTALMAEAGSGIGHYSHTLHLDVTVPPGAVPGFYESQFTISATSGP